MELRILGPFEVVVDDHPVPLPRPKQRALLAFLALNAGEVVSDDRLVDALWGERPPRMATASLQNGVHQLRNVLGAGVIVRHPSAYRLALPPEQVDVGRFSRMTTEARAARDNLERAGKLRTALALWRGPPLAGPEFEFFAQAELPPLLLDRLAAYQDLLDAELALGRHAELIGEIELLIADHPFDERLRVQHGLALYRAGRQADALESLRGTRRLFRDELGLDPGPALGQLEQAILVHDPAIAAPATRLATVDRVRKVVTILAAGIDVPVAVDPEALDALHHRLVEAAFVVAERHGAAASRTPGGGVMVVFGVPAVHEDEALRALRAAVELRDAVAALPDRPGLRVGVESGEAYTHEAAAGDLPVAGAPVAAARRLEQLASPGEIVLGATTLRLVRAAVRTAPLRGRARGTRPAPAAFKLVGIVAGAPAIERHPETPMVDRESELAALIDAFEAVRDLRRCRVLTVVGEPGIGKTRLAGELADSIGEHATVLVGRCVSYGEGATYLPVSEMLAQAGGDLATVLDGAGSTGEEHLALRRHFQSLARGRPLVLVFEDVHWAEPTLLDLIEYLRSQASHTALLVLCLARPELVDDRPAWDVLPLAPLAPEQMLELLDGMGVEDVTSEALRARIAEVAEGNPLYAEQLLADAAEGGTFGSMPPSLELLLGSRLDRLEPEPRRVLQRAAVVGRVFSRAALAAISPTESAPEIDDRLSELARGGLVRVESIGSFRFHHVLLRDVAYGSLPKAERSDLHERLAGWLENGEDELVGYHLEQAYRCRADIGRLDADARRVASSAGARLGTAGIQARKRGDTPAAMNLLERAAGLLPERDSFRLEVLCELGIALRGAGKLVAAEETLAAAAEVGTLAGDRRAELRARLELANVRLFSDPGDRSDEVLAAAREAIPVFEEAGDDRSLSRAWRLISYVEGATRCRFGASTEAAERALVHCGRAGWSTAACLGDLSAALYYGPMPVEAAAKRCRSLLEDADLPGEASVLTFLGGLEAMRGRFRDARRYIARAEVLYDELGETALAHANCETIRGQIELLAGDPAAAERVLRASLEALTAMGDRAHLATRAAELAEAVYRNGRLEDALTLTETAEATGGADDVPTQFLWRGVRAKVLARQGRAAEAEELARNAVALVETTDAPSFRGAVALDLAEVLAHCERADEAAAAAARALDLFEQKGNVVEAERARAIASA